MTRRDRYADPVAIASLARDLDHESWRLPSRATFMEVCGTHTHAIADAGLRGLLPSNVRLISGPGCPVCVTPIDYMDRAVALARRPDVVLCTFGDMLRVPSSHSNLERESARGADVRVVYSPRDALAVARANPERTVVFLGIGFETTMPTVAATLDEAEREGVENLRFLAGAKLIEPPLRALASDPDVQVDGFILPGHVSVILGSRAYAFLERELGVPGVIAGFTPVDVLQAVIELVRQCASGRAEVVNLYPRVVRPEGNPHARALVDRFFQPADVGWRGLGPIPLSGLALREEYAHRDAERIEVELEAPVEPRGCRCGEVLKGMIEPPECPLFDRSCTPGTPVGACMVSSEGTCAAWYRHERALVGAGR